MSLLTFHYIKSIHYSSNIFSRSLIFYVPVNTHFGVRDMIEMNKIFYGLHHYILLETKLKPNEIWTFFTNWSDILLLWAITLDGFITFTYIHILFTILNGRMKNNENREKSPASHTWKLSPKSSCRFNYLTCVWCMMYSQQVVENIPSIIFRSVKTVRKRAIYDTDLNFIFIIRVGIIHSFIAKHLCCLTVSGVVF